MVSKEARAREHASPDGGLQSLLLFLPLLKSLPEDAPQRLTLTRSSLIAGAASVLATRWRVPEDRRTTRFLIDFYQAYRKGPDGIGMRKDQALTSARRKAVERGDPAPVWAAWTLVGDAR